MNSMPDIPDFLRYTPETIAAEKEYWKGRKRTVQGSGFRTIDKAELRLRHHLEREQAKLKAEREAARLKHLREHYR